eukprot:TRINITY_DN13226_c0_g1_i1.p1 TRINITY_DN13226_c0_g1~~TRINITY_DN13226_c0_g1_i1.p1  ORF type:complete len:765 (-),score=165.50 TRINITY_DN13226_c0_g1_i1:304-2598(-)
MKSINLAKFQGPIFGSLPAALLVASFCFTAAVFGLEQKVVYGIDNRIDEYEVDDVEMLAVGQSNVGLFNKGLFFTVDGEYRMHETGTLADNGVCDDERFISQPTAAFCSGFLISSTQIATAGHCIHSANDCSGVAFVFGYAQISATEVKKRYPIDSVYFCSSYTSILANGIDFAVVNLDRPVVGYTPVAIKPNNVQVDDQVYVIGHPTGLPRKYAAGSTVHAGAETSDYYKYFFLADLDTFGGNSGSGVYDKNTHAVAGILVRGATDYVEDAVRGCDRVNVCAELGAAGQCSGEDVTYAFTFKPFVSFTCSEDSECSGHGTCVEGSCSCNTGRFGSDCSFPMQDDICSGNGNVVDLWRCQCDNGYEGDLCEEETTTGPDVTLRHAVLSVASTTSGSFGYQVGITADILVVSQPICEETASSLQCGRVYVMKRNEASWNLVTKLRRPGDVQGAIFGRRLIASEGWILISSEKASAPEATSIYSFELHPVTGEVIRQPKLVAPSIINTGFGECMAKAAEHIAVSAPSANHFTGVAETGAVVVYHITSRSNWGKQGAVIQPSSLVQGEHFGASLAISPSGKLAIGNSPAEVSEEAVYIFFLGQRHLNIVQKITFGTREGFGSALAFLDDILLVSAPKDDTYAQNSGTVQVYELDDDDKFQHIHEVAPQPIDDGKFGEKICVTYGFFLATRSLCGDDEAACDGDGEVEVYSLSNEDVTFVGSLSPNDQESNERFGYSIACTSDLFAIGAPLSGGAFTNGGAVHVYRLE